MTHFFNVKILYLGGQTMFKAAQTFYPNNLKNLYHNYFCELHTLLKNQHLPGFKFYIMLQRIPSHFLKNSCNTLPNYT